MNNSSSNSSSISNTSSRVVRIKISESQERVPQIRPWGVEKFNPAGWEMSLDCKSS